MISFVIPAYNEEALIVNCVQSIFAELGEVTHEVIVVDNASTDDTAKLARLAGAEVIYESRKGITRARQTGFEHAKYDIVAFIDADSELIAGWLDCATRAIARPDVVAVSGPIVYRELNLFSAVTSFWFYCVARIVHIFLPMLQGGNFVLYREALEKVGGFNTNIEFYGEDTDTAIRMLTIGKVRFELGMVISTSARRMQKEGFVRVGLRYIANYLWMWIRGEPWTTKYYDHRSK